MELPASIASNSAWLKSSELFQIFIFVLRCSKRRTAPRTESNASKRQGVFQTRFDWLNSINVDHCKKTMYMV
jgi:hypothetical protein